MMLASLSIIYLFIYLATTLSLAELVAKLSLAN